jgi:hypothetical protein
VLLEHDERVIQAAQELQSQSQNQSPE